MNGRTKGCGRRRIVLGLAAGVAVLLAGPGARALTARPASDYGAVLDAACGRSADHQRQIAEIESALGLALPDARAAELLRRTLCPACGCPLALASGAPGAF